MKKDKYYAQRVALVDHLKEVGIRHPAVLKAILKVPRHVFVEEDYQELAYQDTPLPIREEQTISQPYIVARMTEILLGDRDHLHSVLEIGTGSGYQTAVLAELVDKPYSIERVQALMELAKIRLQSLAINNVELRFGDGSKGWEEQAPYEGIIVTASPLETPPLLLKQLTEGGRLVIPVGPTLLQQLKLYIRQGDKIEITSLEGVRFVPLVTGVR